MEEQLLKDNTFMINEKNHHDLTSRYGMFYYFFFWRHGNSMLPCTCCRLVRGSSGGGCTQVSISVIVSLQEIRIILKHLFLLIMLFNATTSSYTIRLFSYKIIHTMLPFTKLPARLGLGANSVDNRSF